MQDRPTLSRVRPKPLSLTNPSLDGKPDATEAAALAPGLEHPETADLPCRSYVRATVGLDVETDQVHDPHLAQAFGYAHLLRPTQVGHVGDLLHWYETDLHAVIFLDRRVAGSFDRRFEVIRQLRQVEVHPAQSRIHRRPGDLRSEVAEHHRRQHVHTRMSTHQQASTLVIEGSPDSHSRRRQRVVLMRNEVDVVSQPRAHDAGLDTAPEQHTLVRRLPAATRVERRPVEHDAVLTGGV